MLRYFFLSVLIAPQFMGYSIVWDQYIFRCDNYNQSVVQATTSIPLSQVCDGRKDCSDGSDEFLAVCKLNPSSPANQQFFYCASGGGISENKDCDGKDDCWDRSDELLRNCYPTLAKQMLESQRGNCSQGEWQCVDKECIPTSSLCDGQINCSDGADESLAQCYEKCEEDQFQCGNGICISKDKVCDNTIDCPMDGADELQTVCEYVNGYKPSNSYRPCNEGPEENGIFFSESSTYHIANGIKYVLPNEPIRFRCDYYKIIVGTESNVCMLNGTWHHDFPKCLSPREYRDYEAELKKNRTNSNTPRNGIKKLFNLY
ncbi:very low-density lipoprotein receptor-like isoform X1 [Drosophila albomicans]|uniref:Very low-density lipoprotein receptor-like isoform X1 n=1 Tax=Drosophila albomicans TaxID=7291 RepID=A0A6P8ZE28_DROAB|nr:very low-density lipoprotein receptor-like isoform X1 [Drosophila albomicans]